MPLLDVTREFLTIVEKETGYPVKLQEEPDLPTLAVARDNIPAHFVRYRPTHDESLDTLICLQCGFIPGQRGRLGESADDRYTGGA